MERMNEAVQFIHEQADFKPEYGIVLGSGLGNLSDEIEQVAAIPYTDIPHFPHSTVKGHGGKLILGLLSGKKVVAMQGRFHYYEGYSPQEVTFPIRVMKQLGVETLLLSNAAGGLQEHIKIGDLVLINDHINLQPENPLRGKNYDELGPRFPDMMHTYDKELLGRASEIAGLNNIAYHHGVYVGVPGPTLETPAEYTYLHTIGGDAVGMSTVPEVIVARHMDMRVFAVSVITDQGYPKEAIRELTHEDVLRVAGEAEPKVRLIIRELLKGL